MKSPNWDREMAILGPSSSQRLVSVERVWELPVAYLIFGR